MHVIKRPTEADAAWIVVVNEDMGFERESVWNSAEAARARRSIETSPIDREADVVTVTHQEQLRNVSQGERQTHNTVASVVRGVR